MANICDTQYKVTGSRKAVADLWNTLQELEVNSNNVYLYLLAEHYGIDYEKKGISVRGHIYWAEYEENVEDDYALLSFDTESAWSSCDLFFEEVNKALGDELSISWREVATSSIRTMRTTSSPKSATSLHTENSLRIVRVLTPPLVMLSSCGVRRLVSHRTEEANRR